MTRDNILKEIESLPDNRLEEVYQFVKSILSKTEKTNSNKKKILSFSGIFSGINELDYKEYKE